MTRNGMEMGGLRTFDLALRVPGANNEFRFLGEKRYINNVKFEFDPDKSLANLEKHGLDFRRAQLLWQDPMRLEVRARTEGTEERWALIASVQDKLWTAVWTWRGDVIRIISVRRARKEEEVLYG